ncbi:glycosyltransferase involved in cell wall biosynthesis [Paraburkholderia silvatlantica]|uniref:Glycosyltransferase involved in cell wall biosynthesis n=1 Tax=Paraburkholderia silvatlantica TaxID=321895 RepID=A0A2V4TTX1_9BURK|nr:glycosyltransferase family 1 protein [Paraburkholderia silvatlantica]PYE16591.1 glycosyltransferase involved in cell wall biosynthesis [Paraburkholderia silvatlantica]
MFERTLVVGIDGLNLALPKGTGVATYAKNLADNIQAIGWTTSTLYGVPVSRRGKELLREVQFFDCLDGAGRKSTGFGRAIALTKEAFRAPLGYHADRIPVSGRVEAARFISRLPNKSTIYNIEDLFLLARRYFRRHRRFLTVDFDGSIDVMHWTYPMPIKVRNVPNIYTIHDLVPLKLPYTTLDNKRYYFRLIAGCIQNGDRICTVSERSKEDIVDLFGVDRNSVTNTYQAVKTRHSDVSNDSSATGAIASSVYGLEPGSYFLFYGAIEPKKNVGRLIEAYLLASPKAHLVIVGNVAWKANEEMQFITSMLKQNPALARRVRIYDYAPREFLLDMVKAAKAVVFPSLYEGFGLPVLEAMQLGTPTLCSTGGSLPEIAGNASVMVDPYDVRSIAQGLQQLDSDDALRRRLRALGMQRADRFSSSAYRDRLRALYASVLRQP